MRLLLDTHALYWYVEDHPQLSKSAQQLIQDASNEILISPASYWEMAIKISIGKWRLNDPYEKFLDIAINSYGFEILPILPTHTQEVVGLPFHHRDPFDRLLVSQAIAERIPIVSSDSNFDRYSVTRLW